LARRGVRWRASTSKRCGGGAHGLDVSQITVLASASAVAKPKNRASLASLLRGENRVDRTADRPRLGHPTGAFARGLGICPQLERSSNLGRLIKALGALTALSWRALRRTR
jgi:hypothetical protein